MITYLQNKPAVGAIGGFMGGFFGAALDFMTNDKVLHGISICGIWMGFLIAFVTIIVKIIELLEKVKSQSVKNVIYIAMACLGIFGLSMIFWYFAT